MNGRQMLQLLVVGVMLLLLAWIAFYLLIFAIIVGAVAMAVFHLRRFLIAKGIITPKVAPEAPTETNATTIEVEYHEVKTKE